MMRIAISLRVDYQVEVAEGGANSYRLGNTVKEFLISLHGVCVRQFKRVENNADSTFLQVYHFERVWGDNAIQLNHTLKQSESDL